jgi:hypothetical protein
VVLECPGQPAHQLCVGVRAGQHEDHVGTDRLDQLLEPLQAVGRRVTDSRRRGRHGGGVDDMAAGQHDVGASCLLGVGVDVVLAAHQEDPPSPGRARLQQARSDGGGDG